LKIEKMETDPAAAAAGFVCALEVRLRSHSQAGVILVTDRFEE
jgi:hypothetical protein